MSRDTPALYTAGLSAAGQIMAAQPQQPLLTPALLPRPQACRCCCFRCSGWRKKARRRQGTTTQNTTQNTDPCFLPFPSIMSLASFTFAAMKLLPPAATHTRAAHTHAPAHSRSARLLCVLLLLLCGDDAQLVRQGGCCCYSRHKAMQCQSLVRRPCWHALFPCISHLLLLPAGLKHSVPCARPRLPVPPAALPADSAPAHRLPCCLPDTSTDTPANTPSATPGHLLHTLVPG